MVAGPVTQLAVVAETVAVKDANNQAIPKQTVSFSATSGNLTGSLPPPTTGDRRSR